MGVAGNNPGPSPTTPVTSYTALNKGLVDILPGQVVMMDASGLGVILADDLPPARFVGISLDTIAPDFTGEVQVTGVVDLPDWTAGTGSASLDALTPYYLSAVAGKMSASAPNTPGKLLQIIGRPVGPTVFELILNLGVLL